MTEKNNEPAEKSSGQQADVHIHLSSRTLLIVGLLVAATVAIGVFQLKSGSPSTGPKKTVAQSGDRRIDTTNARSVRSAAPSARSEPWGNLESIPIQIEPPDDFISTPRIGAVNPAWNFENYTQQQVVELMNKAPLSLEQRQLLTRDAKWTATDAGTLVEPTVELVRYLSPSSRSIIYTALSECRGNLYQENPFAFKVDGFDRWFKESGLSSSTLETIGHLLYKRGDSLCFSDLELVAADLGQAERQRLLKTLSRQSTLLLKLHVTNRNVDDLVKYWGKGGRTRDVRPVLESMAKVPGGTSIDVTYLLPTLARQLLYTYPYPPISSPVSTNAPQYNCYWTAFNFFAHQADDSLHDVANCKTALARDYYPVQNDLELGDVLMFVKPNGMIVHAAAYIADQVVFAKNGKHFRSPWVLMRMDEMLALYPSEQRLRIFAYRLKDS